MKSCASIISSIVSRHNVMLPSHEQILFNDVQSYSEVKVSKLRVVSLKDTVKQNQIILRVICQV